MSPKISILTTVYNCEKFIPSSIQSILEQSFEDFEYVIINDGSTDRTGEIIEELASKDSRILVIENEGNLGRVKSLNKGLGIVKGKYIALQDADDISLPGRLEKQFNFLESNPDYVLVGSNVIVIDEFENFISMPMRPVNNYAIKFSLLFRCTFANPSIVFRKKAVDEHSLKYEEHFIHAEDFKFITLISQYGLVYNLEEPLVKYRKHSNNISLVYYDTLISGSVNIAKENLNKLKIDIDEEQVFRIRNLIASRGIDKKYLYADVKVILLAIKKFQKKHAAGSNKEILILLRRMQRWLGKKNVILKPKFLLLYISISIEYLKQSILNKKQS